MGATRGQYREAVKTLTRLNFIEIIETCRTRKKARTDQEQTKIKNTTIGTTTVGTKVKLINSTIWDINFDDNNHRNNHPTTTEQPPAEQPTEVFSEIYNQLNNQLNNHRKKTKNNQLNIDSQYNKNDINKNLQPTEKHQQQPPEQPPEQPQTRTKNKKERLLKEKQEKENLFVVPFFKEKMKEDIEALFLFSESKGFDIKKEFFETWVTTHGIDYVRENFNELLNNKKPFASSAGAWFNTALTKNYAGMKKEKELNRQFAEEVKKNNHYASLKINISCATDKETGDDFQYSLPHETFKLALLNKFKNKKGVI